MNKFKKNWFKISLLILGSVYIISIYYGLYLDTKKHTLGVLTQIRQCIKDFDGKNSEQCGNLAKQQLIFGQYFYKKEGLGFD